MKRLIILLFSSLLLSGAVNFADCALMKSGDFLTVAENETTYQDLYFGGRNLDILGTVNADLLAGCQKLKVTGKIAQNLYCGAQSIRIDGEIGGDILGFAQDIEINGLAGSGFRGGCATLLIDGQVNGDVLVGAGLVTIGPQAVVKGDVFLGAGELVVQGTVDGNITGYVDNFELSGSVSKNVRLNLERCKFEPSGKIGGNFQYSSEKSLPEEIKKQVAGEVIFKPIVKEVEEGCKAFSWWWKIWVFISSIITAIILIALFKRKTVESIEAFPNYPWNSLLIGLLGLIVIPVVVIIALIFVFTIPLALILALLYTIFLYLGWILGAILAGYLLLLLVFRRSLSLYLSALVGIIALVLLNLIPVFGGIVNFVAILAGMGVILSGIYTTIWKSI